METVRTLFSGVRQYSPEAMRVIEKTFNDLPVTIKNENSKAVLKINVDDALFSIMKYAHLEVAVSPTRTSSPRVDTSQKQVLSMANIGIAVLLLHVSPVYAMLPSYSIYDAFLDDVIFSDSVRGFCPVPHAESLYALH